MPTLGAQKCMERVKGTNETHSKLNKTLIICVASLTCLRKRRVSTDFFCSRPLLGHVLRQEAASCRDRRWQASREIEVTSYKRKRLNRRSLQRRRRNENLRYFFFSSIWKKKSCCDRCHSCKKSPERFLCFSRQRKICFPPNILKPTWLKISRPLEKSQFIEFVFRRFARSCLKEFHLNLCFEWV